MYSSKIKRSSPVLRKHIKKIIEGFCRELQIGHGSHAYSGIFVQLKRNLVKLVAETQNTDNNIAQGLQLVHSKKVKGTNNKLYELKYVQRAERVDRVTIYSSTENLSPKIVQWCIDKRFESITNPTPSEAIAKEKLKNIKGFMVITQMPFYILGGIYFADFFLPEFNTIIEIDGGYHNAPSQKRKDEKRTTFLNSAGIRVVRASNEEAVDTMKLYQIVYDLLNESNKLKRKVKPMRRIQEHIDQNEEFAQRKIKPRKRKEVEEQPIESDALIVGNVAGLLIHRREWIYSKQAELAEKMSIPEKKLKETFDEAGIEAIFKCPIFANNIIHFVDFYVPQYRVGVDLRSPNVESNLEFAAIKKINLEAGEIAYMAMYEKEAFNPRIIQYIKTQRFKSQKNKNEQDSL